MWALCAVLAVGCLATPIWSLIFASAMVSLAVVKSSDGDDPLSRDVLHDAKRQARREAVRRVLHGLPAAALFVAGACLLVLLAYVVPLGLLHLLRGEGAAVGGMTRYSPMGVATLERCEEWLRARPTVLTVAQTSNAVLTNVLLPVRLLGLLLVDPAVVRTAALSLCVPVAAAAVAWIVVDRAWATLRNAPSLDLSGTRFFDWIKGEFAAPDDSGARRVAFAALLAMLVIVLPVVVLYFWRPPKQWLRALAWLCGSATPAALAFGFVSTLALSAVLVAVRADGPVNQLREATGSACDLGGSLEDDEAVDGGLGSFGGDDLCGERARRMLLLHATFAGAAVASVHLMMRSNEM